MTDSPSIDTINNHLQNISITELAKRANEERESNPEIAILDWDGLYEIFPDDDARKLIDTLRRMRPEDLGFMPRVDIENQPPSKLVPLKQHYTGANGKEYTPLPKYLPEHVLMAYHGLQESYLEYLRSSSTNNRPGFILVSGYRSPAYQVLVLFDVIEREGIEEALQSVSLPEHSEHSDLEYTAMDFTCIGDERGEVPNKAEKGRTAFEDYQEFDWLLENGAKHGFALTYFPDPSDPGSGKTSDGFDYEPWHWRYLGANAETFMDTYQVQKIIEKRRTLLNKSSH